MLQAQRCAALRVSRCYRTVSDLAALVLAGMPPAFLKASGRKRVMVARRTGVEFSKSEIMDEVIRQLQVLWESTSTKAAWTKRLIPDLIRWWNNGPKEIGFHMAQVLSGHSCFQSYLSRMGKANSATCVHCSAETDDSEHTVFNCSFWDERRAVLTTAIGRPVVPEDVADLLCGPVRSELPEDPTHRMRILSEAKVQGEMFQAMVNNIMGTKEELERLRQRAEF